jgi:alpha-ketoglutarate-dependent taurine dioxygenase
MPAEVFKENTILLMDNARFLHSRTDIKDPKRWLRRVRFHGTPGSKESA